VALTGRSPTTPTGDETEDGAWQRPSGPHAARIEFILHEDSSAESVQHCSSAARVAERIGPGCAEGFGRATWVQRTDFRS
jgi:hypothetical protein